MKISTMLPTNMLLGCFTGPRAAHPAQSSVYFDSFDITPSIRTDGLSVCRLFRRDATPDDPRRADQPVDAILGEAPDVEPDWKSAGTSKGTDNFASWETDSPTSDMDLGHGDDYGYDSGNDGFFMVAAKLIARIIAPRATIPFNALSEEF